MLDIYIFIFLILLKIFLILYLGAEVFSEGLLYSIMIGLPIYELYRQTVDSNEKKLVYNSKL